MGQYKKTITYWNKVFNQMPLRVPETIKTGIAPIDDAIDWLCEGTDHTLDFGCGSGMLLLMCAKRGQKHVEGIDISAESIAYARKLFAHADLSATFSVGGVEYLKTLKSDAYEGLILSNIIDNLNPEDALETLIEATRFLKAQGKVFLKLNDYASFEQVKDFKKVDAHTYLEPSGLYLFNLPTKAWEAIVETVFDSVKVERIYIERAKQYNRVLLLRRKTRPDYDALRARFEILMKQ